MLRGCFKTVGRDKDGSAAAGLPYCGFFASRFSRRVCGVGRRLIADRLFANGTQDGGPRSQSLAGPTVLASNATWPTGKRNLPIGHVQIMPGDLPRATARVFHVVDAARGWLGGRPPCRNTDRSQVLREGEQRGPGLGRRRGAVVLLFQAPVLS